MWVHTVEIKKINTQKHKKKPRADNLCLLTGTKCENESVWGTLCANIKKKALAINVVKTCFSSAKRAGSHVVCNLESSAVLPSSPLCAFVPSGI